METNTLEYAKKLAEEKEKSKELLEALILAKNTIIELSPIELSEEKMTEHAKPNGTWMKIINAINKATK